MKNSFKLILSIVGCQLLGIIGSVFTVNTISTWYASLNKPFFSPPNWVFGPTWTILYFLMGVAFYLIWKDGFDTEERKVVRKYFIIQLVLNFLWSPIFFGLTSPQLGLFIILPMLYFIFLTINSMKKISKVAAYLLIPYFLWVSFATILNAAIFYLN